MSSKTNNEPLSPARLRRTLLEHLGVLSDKSLVLAYSGGVDSKVLLHLLVDLRDREEINLQAIHVNHRIHKDADHWEVICRDTCGKLDVPIITEKVDVVGHRSGIEAAAREARYQAFERHILSPQHVLLTAHHVDDQAETLLLHLVRGAGVSGLAAMPWRRPLGVGTLVRPLLDCSRNAIVDYARQHALDWVEDDSNKDPLISRSYIRQEIFPRLARRWPGTVEAFARAARHMSEADALLRDLADSDLAACLGPDAETLSLSRLGVLSTARLRNVLRQWLRQQNVQMPSTRQLDQLCWVILHPLVNARAQIFLGEGQALIYRDKLSFIKGELPAVPGETAWDLSRLRPVCFGDYRVSAEEAVGSGLSKERTGNLVSLRVRKGGERCILPGRAHHTSLKKLLQENGIPPWERERLPLLFVDGDLAAIGDRWVCEPYAAKSGEPSWSLSVSKNA